MASPTCGQPARVAVDSRRRVRGAADCSIRCGNRSLHRHRSQRQFAQRRPADDQATVQQTHNQVRQWVTLTFDLAFR